MAEERFSIHIDTETIEKDAERAAKQFEEINKAAQRSGTSMDETFKKAANGMADQEKVLKQLQHTLKAVSNSLSQWVDDDIWQQISDESGLTEIAAAIDELAASEEQLSTEELAECEAAVKEVVAALTILNQATGETEGGQETLRRKIKELKDEMGALALENKENTQEYRELQKEMARLTDIMGDINQQGRILANDEAFSAGILSGLTGLSSALSAASGAVGMFTQDNEKLQQVLLKVQSAMAITTGLQQLQQTLNKDSAFRLVIINGLKEYWAKVTAAAAASETALAGATTATGVAATGTSKAFRAMGAAIKGIPGIGWLLAAVSAIGAAIAVVVKRQKEHSEELKRQKIEVREIQKAHLDAQNSILKEVAALETQVKKLKTLKTDSEEYKKVVKDVADTIGLQEEYVKKNIKAVETLIDKWKAVKIAQSLSGAYIDKMTEAQMQKYSIMDAYQNGGKTLKEQMELLDSFDWVSKAQKDAYKKARKDYDNLQRQMTDTPEMWAKRQAAAWKKVSDAMEDIYAAADKRIDKYNKEVNDAYDKEVAAVTEYNKLKPNKPATTTTTDTTDWKKQIKESASVEIMLNKKLQQEVTDNKIAVMDDGLQRELDAIENEYNKRIDVIDEMGAKLLEERQKQAKAEAALKGTNYDENLVTLTKEQQQLLKQLYDYAKKQANKKKKAVVEAQQAEYNALLEQYADFAGKIEIINKKYDEQLKNAGSNETLKGSINTARQKGIADLVMDSFNLNTEIGKLSQSIDTLGKKTQTALLAKLKEIVTFVKQNKGNLSAATSANAQSLGINKDVLESMLQNEESLQRLLDLYAELENKTKGVDSLKVAFDNLKKAKDKFNKDGSVINKKDLEDAEKAVENMITTLTHTAMQTVADIGNAMKQIGEMVGSEGLTKAGEVVDDILGNIQAAEEGAKAWGGWWGAIIGGVIDLIPKVVKWVTAGSAKVVEDAETALAHTEMMMNYYKQIANADYWQAPDFVGTYNSAEVQGIIQQIKDLRKSRGWEIWHTIEAAASASLLAGVEETKDAIQAIKTYTGRIKTINAQISQLSKDLLNSMNKNAYSITKQQAYEKTMQLYDDKIQELQDKIEALARHPKKNAENLQQTMIELAQTTQEKIDETLAHAESVVGKSASTMYDDIYSMIADALDNGKDSVDDFTTYFNKAMLDMVRKNVLMKVLEGQLEPYINMLSEGMTAFLQGDVDENYLSGLINYVGNDINNLINTAYSGLKELGNLGLSVNNDISATSKGIAQASQESVDELNGRMTVIQAHTYELVQSSSLSATNIALLVSVVNNIHDDTHSMRGTLLEVAQDVHTIKNNL